MKKLPLATLTLLLATAGTAQPVEEPSTLAAPEPAPVAGQGSFLKRPHLAVWAFSPFLDGLGVGAGVRWSQPVFSSGLVRGLEDSLAVELGADLAARFFSQANPGFSLAVPLELRWSFALSDALSIYPKVGAGWTFTQGTATALGLAGFYWDVAVGGAFALGSSLAVRAEVGPRGLRAGVALAF